MKQRPANGLIAMEWYFRRAGAFRFADVFYSHRVAGAFCACSGGVAFFVADTKFADFPGDEFPEIMGCVGGLYFALGTDGCPLDIETRRHRAGDRQSNKTRCLIHYSYARNGGAFKTARQSRHARAGAAPIILDKRRRDNARCGKLFRALLDKRLPSCRARRIDGINKVLLTYKFDAKLWVSSGIWCNANQLRRRTSFI